jgi:HSP20 family protein
MSVKDLLPSGRKHSLAPRLGEGSMPFLALHREMDRLFDDFLRGFDLPLTNRLGWTQSWPKVEVSESDKEVRVVAELPGLDEKDVEITLNDGVLTLKGEKKVENESAVYSERWHGQFERSMQLGQEIDPEKVEATFKNGVLTVTLARRPEAVEQVKRIPIKG